MSRIMWQWRDGGSGGPGHMQRVVIPDDPDPYAAFMKHCPTCPYCGFGQTRCDIAEGLWREHLSSRTSPRSEAG